MSALLERLPFFPASKPNELDGDFFYSHQLKCRPWVIHKNFYSLHIQADAHILLLGAPPSMPRSPATPAFSWVVGRPAPPAKASVVHGKKKRLFARRRISAGRASAQRVDSTRACRASHATVEFRATSVVGLLLITKHRIFIFIY